MSLASLFKKMFARKKGKFATILYPDAKKTPISLQTKKTLQKSRRKAIIMWMRKDSTVKEKNNKWIINSMYQ